MCSFLEYNHFMKSKRIYLYLIKLIQENKDNDKFKFPSENKIASMFDSSRATVRSVFSKLKSEKIIYSMQGKGYFINSTEKLNSYAVINSRWMKNQKNITVKTISFEEINDTCDNFSDEYYQIKRIKKVDGLESELVVSKLSKKYFPSIDINESNISISEYIKKHTSYMIRLQCKTTVVKNNYVDNGDEFITRSIYSYYDDNNDKIAESIYYLSLNLFHIEYNKMI